MTTNQGEATTAEAHAAPPEAWGNIAEGYDRYVAPQEVGLANEVEAGLQRGARPDGQGFAPVEDLELLVEESRNARCNGALGEIGHERKCRGDVLGARSAALPRAA